MLSRGSTAFLIACVWCLDETITAFGSIGMHDRMQLSRRPLPATDPIFEAGNLERELKAREAAPRVQNCMIADYAFWTTRLCIFAVKP